MTDAYADIAMQWQDQALAAERKLQDAKLENQNLAFELGQVTAERDQLRRRLTSAETELNLVVDQLEDARARIWRLEHDGHDYP